MLLTPDDLHDYQSKKAIPFLREKDFAALWVDMGLGKTVSAETAIDEALMLGRADVFFVFAPIRVCYTVWRQEAAKWSHLRHLKFSLVHGNERRRYDALRKKADVYLINYENIVWLLNAMRNMPGFPKGKLGAIFDEASMLKAHKTKRFKALKKMLDRFSIIWELTGTPAPNSYLDIWSQIYLLDKGARLTNRFDLYREEFFKKSDYMGYNYSIRSGAQRRIERLIAPLVLRLDGRDYDKMSRVIVNDMPIILPDPIMRQYKQLEDEFFLRLEEMDIAVFNAAALTTKLWQFTNGALYDENHDWHEVHTAKLDALEEVMEEASGQPVMVAYWFQSDLARLKRRFGNDIPVMTKDNAEDMVVRWNRGELKWMFVHPRTAGHGLNLQAGGHHIFLFSLMWSLELYLQLIARLARQGQKLPVIVHRPIVQHSVDIAQAEALDNKARTQSQLLDALRRYRHTEELLS